MLSSLVVTLIVRICIVLIAIVLAPIVVTSKLLSSIGMGGHILSLLVIDWHMGYWSSHWVNWISSIWVGLVHVRWIEQ